jgi:hypothetical protein
MQLNRVAAKSAVANLTSEIRGTAESETDWITEIDPATPGLIGHVRAHGYNAWPALF